MQQLYFQTPYCQYHPKEKVLRICTNISCQRYFKLACIECLDTHNHNIQELIKIKEFFAQISSQTGGPQMKEKNGVSQNSSKKNSFEYNNNNYKSGNEGSQTKQEQNQSGNQEQLQQQQDQKNLENGKQNLTQLKQIISDDFDDDEVQVLNNDEFQQQQQQLQLQIQNLNHEEFEMIVCGGVSASAKQENAGLKFQQPDILDDQILNEYLKNDSPRDKKNQQQEETLMNQFQSQEQGGNNQEQQDQEEQQKQNENYVKIHQIQTLMQQMNGIIQIADIIKTDLSKMEVNLQKEIKNSPQGVVNKVLKEIAEIPENDANYQQAFYDKIEQLKSYLSKDQSRILVKTNETQEIQQILDVYSNVFSAEIANTFKSLNQLASLDFQNFKKTYSCKFIFSPNLKGRNILLGNGNKVALQQSSEERFILLDPQINLNIKTRWAFRILDTGTWIGVGIANKDIIQLEKYQFTKYTGNGRHGSYMFSNNGYSWNYMQQYSNMQMNSFQYKTKDTILVEYNPKYKKLVVINLEEKKVCVMDISNLETQFKHHPCVNMCQGAKIQILDNFIWPTEQALREFKETSKKEITFLFDYSP
ncbi:hypothetical protein PPERSA_10493 [Pseudocohnilembus persalinus]|uniref:Uncharacterized protein n=1 Tax=Pseudocohnilembus persalinus TaxID=266149 RepID=A0A0V0R7T7_PSEPJ|nr:hypothetical protein PPERSA_10493 [Pseudocohnilembus persalinus]|eukprot:KRX10394.1 hypothetical protein PPERSA_10493 [Pseudocohnilembus persalinus]